jgi:hypothetical protein
MLVVYKNLDVNSHISVSSHHLKCSETLELLKGKAYFNTPDSLETSLDVLNAMMG